MLFYYETARETLILNEQNNCFHIFFINLVQNNGIKNKQKSWLVKQMMLSIVAIEPYQVIT